MQIASPTRAWPCRVFLVALCAALFTVGLGAPSAFAKRTINSKIGGLDGAFSVAIDNKDDVWVTDGGEGSEINPGNEGVYEYNPFPSQTRLAVPNTYSWLGYYIFWLTAAVDDANGEIFIAQANGRQVEILAPNSASNQCPPFSKEDTEPEPYCYTHQWTRINSANSCFNCSPDIHIAIDNSETFSEGRVYLSLTSPENDVEMFDADQRPVDFPATAGYIANNKLTGTPSGRFGEVSNVAVDSYGNLYVTDAGDHVVDEFDSTGTFVHAFPDPNASVGFPGTGGAGVDPTNGNVLIAGGGGLEEYDSSGNHLETLNSDGTGSFYPGPSPAVNSNGYVYAPSGGNVDIFSPNAVVPTVTYEAVASPTTTSGTLKASINPNGGGNVTECKFEYVVAAEFNEAAANPYAAGKAIPCEQPTPYAAKTDVSAALSGLTTEATYHYRVVVHNANEVKYGADQIYTPHKVVGLVTEAATGVTENAATLNGSLAGNGEETHYYFEWGRTESYGNTTAAPPGASAGTGAAPLSADLTGLAPYSTYHYRVVASNGAGTSQGEDRMFTTTPGVPSVEADSISGVHSDRVLLHGTVNPNGANASAHFEYVTDEEFQQSGFANAGETSPQGIGMSKHGQEVSQLVVGLQPGTLYHYRAVGVNDAGTGTPSTEYTFTSFAFEREVKDSCPNAHVRQQTGTALLEDCRAYELVSAANAGGYDVESALVAGQTPFSDYPEAENPSQVLYGVHDGGIPGTGIATNRGIDPYVATRGESGWTTKYVGIPGDDPNATSPFSSTLSEADPGLDTFAFGGSEICSPCFADGSSGEPIHLPDGQLVQGMAGSIPQPTAKPAGFIAKHLSADGSHFVFGSTSKFEPEANEGEISIYDRNLNAAGIETHVVSKTPAGQPMKEEGEEIGELDISGDGSRIVIGHLVEEAEGAKRWHLYMNIGDSTKTVDLTPGTTHGVLFDGMTEDGSKVFFTSADALSTSANQDTDTSADIYEAEVSPAGALTLSRISTGTEGTGNTNACDPSANTAHEHWNTTGSSANCGVVAVGGGGGVAKSDGTIYFLSPEKLDGSSNGVQNAPNLYVARPGQAPQFVATLESSSNAPLPPSAHSYIRSFGGFENPTGVAVEQATGDVYVLDPGTDIGTGFIYKFDPSGHPVLGFGSNGKISVSGMLGFYSLPTEIAVDNDPSSPSYGDIYVPEIGRFGASASVKKYTSKGALEGKLEAEDAYGVSVNPSNGDVYIVSGLGGVYVYNAKGEPTGPEIFLTPQSPQPSGIAVDSSGNSYIVNGGGEAAAKGTTQVYNAAGKFVKTLDENPSYGVAVDPVNNDVYVDEGKQVSEFGPGGGEEIGTPTGSGLLGSSISLAADAGALFVSNPSDQNVASYAPSSLPGDPETDNPLVIDSVSSPEARHAEDFQVNASGNDAVFTSTLPLTGYDSGRVHREVFRYDSPGAQLDCASCNPTSEQATAGSSLPATGLAVSGDGRVFFNSQEGLVDRDLNEKEDAYQWEPDGYEFGHGASPCKTGVGCVQLISTGASPFASSLFGISADGTDAYFFTRDKLTEQDQNGNTVKIYDARALGGYPFVFPEPQCKASDECHGPGTAPPPPPEIKTVAPAPGGDFTTTAAAKCKAGFVKKHGTCVRKPKKSSKRHHHRKGHRHHG